MVNILPGAPRQDPMERMLALFRVGMTVRAQKEQAEQNAAELKLRAQQLMQQAKAQKAEGERAALSALLRLHEQGSQNLTGGNLTLPDFQSEELSPLSGMVLQVLDAAKKAQDVKSIASSEAAGTQEGSKLPIPAEARSMLDVIQRTQGMEIPETAGGVTPTQLQTIGSLVGKLPERNVATQSVPEAGLVAGQAYDPASSRASLSVWQEGQQNFRSKEARAAAQERWSQLSPAQQLAETRQLGKQYLDATQAPRIVQTQYKVMEDTMKGITSGEFKDLNAPTQVIVNTFNKIIDPSSVVRESEYARSPDGQALLDSLVGKAAALARGGPGLTPGNLREFVRLAKVFADNSVKSMESEKQRVLDIADAYKIPRNHIVAGEKATTETATATTTQTPTKKKFTILSAE